MDESYFYENAFLRNLGLLSETQQDQLKNTTIAIAGLGGVGGIYASTFARLGIGNFRIADMDTFDVINLNRQAGATSETIGKPKVEAIKDMIKGINPFATVTVFPNGIDQGNIHDFLRGADIVLDGIDFFSMSARRLLFQESRKVSLFVFTAAPVGFGSSMIVFDPHGMSFDEYFDLNDNQTLDEQLFRFGIGVTPTLIQKKYFRPQAIDWKTQQAPSLVTGTLLCANLISCEVLKVLFGEKIYPAPHSVHFDPYVKVLKKVWVPWGNKNPWQKLKRIIVVWMVQKRKSSYQNIK